MHDRRKNRLKNLLQSYPTGLTGHGRRTWIAVHGGEVVLVVLVWGQLPGADRGVERVRVGDKVGVSQVGGQVVRGGERRGVGGRVALRRLGGHHHPADPCGVLQHLRETERCGFEAQVAATGGGGRVQMVSLTQVRSRRCKYSGLRPLLKQRKQFSDGREITQTLCCVKYTHLLSNACAKLSYWTTTNPRLQPRTE